MNTKHLYQADGYSVRELLKATTVLYNALRANVENLESDNSDMNISFDISAKVSSIFQFPILWYISFIYIYLGINCLCNYCSSFKHIIEVYSQIKIFLFVLFKFNIYCFVQYVCLELL